MGVQIRAVLPALVFCLCLVAVGCAKPRAQAAAPAPPSGTATAFYDPDTGESCGELRKHKEPGITLPKPTYSPEPQFTEGARRAKESGRVNLIVDLGTDGRVKHVCLLRTYRKDEAAEAIKTVRTWRFEPARKDGVPIPYTMTVDVTFNIY